MTLSRPVRDVFVYSASPNVFHCDDDHGSVTGYDVSGMSATAAFTSFDSSLPFCGDEWWSSVTDFGYRTRGTFDVAYDFYALLPTLTSVQRIVITPPPVRAWTTCNTLFAGADSIEASCGPLTGPDSFAVYFREAAPSVSVAIITAKGSNDGGSFTPRAGEQQITLEATVTPAALAASVHWSVVPAPEAAAETQAPGTIPLGATSGFPVPTPAPGRWQAYGHPGDLNVKRLGYKATATVSSGGTQYQSTPPPTRVYQDEVDVAREEYVELGVSRGVPARGVFGAHFGNRGDYGVAVINPDFDRSFVALELQWSPSTLQVNSLYRNPVHNRWHVPGAANSLHQYGCAADLLGPAARRRGRRWLRHRAARPRSRNSPAGL